MTAAHTLFTGLASLPDDLAGVVLGDFLTEGLKDALFNTCGGQTDETGDYLWTGICGAMLSLSPDKHRELLLEALDASLIQAGFIDERAILDAMQGGPEKAADTLSAAVETARESDVHDWMAR